MMFNPEEVKLNEIKRQITEVQLKFKRYTKVCDPRYLPGMRIGDKLYEAGLKLTKTLGQICLNNLICKY